MNTLISLNDATVCVYGAHRYINVCIFKHMASSSTSNVVHFSCVVMNTRGDLAAAGTHEWTMGGGGGVSTTIAGSIYLWSVQSNQLLIELLFHSSTIASLHISPGFIHSHPQLASVDCDATLRLSSFMECRDTNEWINVCHVKILDQHVHNIY